MRLGDELSFVAVMPQRLIPRFSHRQLEAIASIPVDSHPELEARFELKALTHNSSLIERVWWDQGTGQAVVEQANISDQQWRIVPGLWYSTLPQQVPLLLTLVGDTAEEYEGMIEQMLGSSVFQLNCIGSWSKAIAWTPGRDRWLIKDLNYHDQDDKAKQAWRVGKPLPEGYYYLDREAAIRAIENGVIQHGRGFLEGEATESMINESLQMALLGDIVHD